MMNQLQDSKKDFLLVSFVSSNLQQLELNSSQSIFRSFIVFSTTQQREEKNNRHGKSVEKVKLEGFDVKGGEEFSNVVSYGV